MVQVLVTINTIISTKPKITTSINPLQSNNIYEYPL